MLGQLRGYAKALIGITGWKLALTLAIMVVSSLTEGFGLALMLPTLQLAGVDIGAPQRGGPLRRLVRAGLCRDRTASDAVR